MHIPSLTPLLTVFSFSYLGGLIYLTYRLPFVECLMFGALISATDPVTVLSIFQVCSFSLICLSIHCMVKLKNSCGIGINILKF